MPHVKFGVILTLLGILLTIITLLGQRKLPYAHDTFEAADCVLAPCQGLNHNVILTVWKSMTFHGQLKLQP